MQLFVTLVSTLIFGFWFSIGTDLECNDFCTKKNESFYTAAVVEYKPIPIGSQSPVEALLSNTREYVQLIQNASEMNADIIVFPEYGITTIALPPRRDQAREYFVEVPNFGDVPCNNSSGFDGPNQILYELSCAARSAAMYVVVNLGEVDACDQDSDPKCPPDGAYQYNTNVVFDREGAIIARYRKFHLYFEPQFDYPDVEYSTFQTDFGVEFGLFTCFDIIFAHPAVELVANQGVRNFVFPTAWIDELPFLMATQAQSLWAQSNHVNLLASGYHQPDRGSMGSGIFSGDSGALNYVFHPDSGTQLIISSVPPYPRKELLKLPIPTDSKLDQSYHMWLREDLTNCSYKLINPTLKQDSLCHEDLCCDIEYDIISPENGIGSGQLVLLAFDGRRTVAAKRDYFDWQICAILHCLNETLESCTENDPSLDDHPKFSSIKIKMGPLKTEYEQEATAEPALSLIDTHFRLIPHQYFTLETVKDTNNQTYAEARTNNPEEISLVNIKTVSVIQKVYGGR